jgi:hypothetical protein
VTLLAASLSRAYWMMGREMLSVFLLMIRLRCPGEVFSDLRLGSWTLPCEI